MTVVKQEFGVLNPRDAAQTPSVSEAARRKRSHALLPAWVPRVMLVALIGIGVAGGVGMLPAKLPPRATLAPELPAVAGPPTNAQTPAAPGASSSSPSYAGATARQNELKITVAHLVVTHRDTPLGRHHQVTRSRQEAKRRAQEALARARKGEDFGALVLEYSDEPGAKERRGRFANFARRHSEKNFGDAAFALEPGGISDVVTSAFGFHVIMREK